MPNLIKRLITTPKYGFYTWLDWLYVSYRQTLDFVFRSKPPMSPRHDTSRHETEVVVIPGVYEPWSFMRPLMKVIASKGYPIHVIEGLGYNTGSIPDMAKLVHNYIDQLGCQQVVIVAHSKGGLIGKYVLANYNQNAVVRHVIAINTPFAGSTYANLAPVRSVRMFAPGDPELQRLQQNQLINTFVTSIYSTYDPNIPKGSFLEGAANVPIDTIGHFRIIANRQLHQRVLAILMARDGHSS